MIEVIKDWDPTCRAIIEKTPEDAIIDFKLVYRDPLPSWISKGGRIALLGDAAHPFLPTSVPPPEIMGFLILVDARRKSVDGRWCYHRTLYSSGWKR